MAAAVRSYDEPEDRHVFHIPDDLIVDILLRLPVKSLLRFKSVCKLWRTMITSSVFSNLHLVDDHDSDDNGDDTTLLLCWIGCEQGTIPHHRDFGRKIFAYGFTLVSNETFKRVDYHPDYLEVPGRFKDIRGPCNGVFCIRIWRNKLALWNPATRRLRPLPFDEDHHVPLFLSKQEDGCGFGCEFGFGMDPLTGQLKIVAIDENCGFNKFCLYRHQYSRSWMIKDSDQLQVDGGLIRFNPCSRSFINGFCYWIRVNTSTKISVILAFDIHNEVFEVIELPESIRNEQYGSLDLYNDCLAIFAVNTNLYDGSGDTLEVWIMKEKGSWTKLFRMLRPDCQCTLSFLSDDEVLIHRQWMVFDMDSGKRSHIDALEAEDVDVLEVSPLYSYNKTRASLKDTNIGDHDHHTHYEDCDILSPLSRQFFEPDLV